MKFLKIVLDIIGIIIGLALIGGFVWLVLEILKLFGIVTL